MRPLASFTKAKLEVDSFFALRSPLNQAFTPAAAQILSSDLHQTQLHRENTSAGRLSFS